MMTDPWKPDSMQAYQADEEFFNVRDAQGHLLIVRVRDEVARFATSDCPDGLKLLMRGKNKGKWVNNNVVRATIADLNVAGEDGQLGKIYNVAVIFAGTLVKDLKFNVGKTLLMLWKQDDPSDKSSPYSYMMMDGNEQAVTAARDFLTRHPEFMTIPEPPAYVLQAREEAPQQQPQGGYPQPQQPPAGWNTAAPPPEYYQQQPQWQPQGPPPQQPYPQWQQPVAPQAPPQPQGNGSFLSRAQGNPAFYAQHEPNGPVNHQGQPQSQEAPF